MKYNSAFSRRSPAIASRAEKPAARTVGRRGAPATVEFRVDGRPDVVGLITSPADHEQCSTGSRALSLVARVTAQPYGTGRLVRGRVRLRCLRTAALGPWPKARKGPTEVDGAPAYRLSGNLTQDQLRSMDRRLYDKMRTTGTKEFACDVWVNESGRVVRFEQWLEMSGKSARNVVTFKNFKDPVAVSAPE